MLMFTQEMEEASSDIQSEYISSSMIICVDECAWLKDW